MKLQRGDESSESRMRQRYYCAAVAAAMVVSVMSDGRAGNVLGGMYGRLSNGNATVTCSSREGRSESCVPESSRSLLSGCRLLWKSEMDTALDSNNTTQAI